MHTIDYLLFVICYRLIVEFFSLRAMRTTRDAASAYADLEMYRRPKEYSIFNLKIEYRVVKGV